MAEQAPEDFSKLPLEEKLSHKVETKYPVQRGGGGDRFGVAVGS